MSLEETHACFIDKLKLDLKHSNAIACDLRTKNDELVEANEKISCYDKIVWP